MKIDNNWKPLDIYFHKSSIVDIWQVPNYASNNKNQTQVPHIFSNVEFGDLFTQPYRLKVNNINTRRKCEIC